MVKKKKEEITFDGRIWPVILEFNVNIDSQLTSKANFIFGASTLILLFILNILISDKLPNSGVLRQLPLIILLTGSFLTSLLSITIVLPKLRIFSNKERIKEDIFYYKNILKFYSRKEYVAALRDLPMNNKRIGEAYANQIYSLARNIIPFKFKILKISGWILIISIFFSILSYFILSYT